MDKLAHLEELNLENNPLSEEAKSFLINIEKEKKEMVYLTF